MKKLSCATEMTNDEIREKIKALNQTIEDREQDKVDEIPKGVLDKLSKKLCKFKELCDGVDEITTIDIAIEKYPVFVEFCTDDGFYVTDHIDELEEHLPKGTFLFDVLEQHPYVQSAIEAKNAEFELFSEEVEVVAEKYECEVRRVWDVIDTNSLFHE